MSKKAPKYSLNDIKAAVKKDNINFNKSCYGDIVALGYDLEGVKKCILSLSEDDFINTQEYKEGRYKLVCDEYLLSSYHDPSDHTDDLSIYKNQIQSHMDHNNVISSTKNWIAKSE